nr:hypothetical protein CFP56_16729 [Quercus suber]
MEPSHHDTHRWLSPGVFTKTVIDSPVIRWIFQARIRGAEFNDVLQVGSDFIHVKQVDRRGGLVHIASQNGFGAQIRAARILDIDHGKPDFDQAIKLEAKKIRSPGTVAPPPQLLVLTLSWPMNELVFVYMAIDLSKNFQFEQRRVPLMTFDRVLTHPGEHLTVESQSRAIAVAALDKEIMLYSLKSKAQLRNAEFNKTTWCPVAAERAVQVDGAIQHLEFLIPPEDDIDHIVVLVIIVDDRRTKAVYIDWHHGSTMSDIHIHIAQPLDFDRTVSSILVPLRDAAFLMTTGDSTLSLFQGILSGSIRCSVFSTLEDIAPVYPSNSPRHPCWTSWCRLARSMAKHTECFYLVREDGIICYLEIIENGSGISPTFVGELGCHVSTAFECLESPGFLDILVAAGDLSTGCVMSTGQFFSGGLSMPDSGYAGMELVQRLPNWASVTDMMITGLPQLQGRTSRPRDSVIVTSSRQPYGAITELRHGFEAQVVTVMTDDESSTLLRSVTDLWPLPVTEGTLLLVLSGPYSTILFMFTDLLGDASQLDDNEVSALDLENPTHTAVVTQDRRIVQITEKCICITTSLDAASHDSWKQPCPGQDSIIKAAVEPHTSVFVTAERSGSEYKLRSYSPPQHLTEDLQPATVISLECLPLAIAITSHDSFILAVTGTEDLKLHFYTLNDKAFMQSLYDVALPGESGGHNACESIVFLQSSVSTKFLAICGLRDGTLFPVCIDLYAHSDQAIHVGAPVQLGQSTVRLTQLEDDGSSVCAISGSDTCRISWDGQDPVSLFIHPILFADKARPSRSQGDVTACSLIPAGQSCDILNDELRRQVEMEDVVVVISDGELIIAKLDHSLSTVPFQMPVSGTPNRVIYDARHRCLVCASQRTQNKSSRTSMSPRPARQIFPSIELINTRSKIEDIPYTYDMKPGEQVFALASWSYAPEGETDKTYSFILVGGSYTSSKDQNRQKGRIAFLQPRLDNRQIVGVKASTSLTFDDAVYAITAYDETTFVICHGIYVSIYQFSYADRKWESVCQPIVLTNRGSSVSVSKPLIHVATSGDSLVTLRLDDTAPRRRLVHHANGPDAAVSLSHLIISPDQDSPGPSVALLSTMYRTLIGLATHHPTAPSPHPSQHNTLFTATLPVSLTRLRRGNIRPSWRGPAPSGILADDILGCATDGALYGVALLDRALTRRLTWLQRLCEWSPALSPHTHHRPAYNPRLDASELHEQGIPAGLAPGASGEVRVRTHRSASEGMHVDGDVLARLVKGDWRAKVAGLKEFMRELAAEGEGRGDRAGMWLAGHVEEEVAALDDLVGILRRLGERWI